ncbi:MAG TPA: ribosome-binding factor A [Thermoflexia bacterium]|nr:ribosome-binding factor A [Thermoflexia bacterium]
MGRKYVRRINELLRRKITLLLLEESKDPRLNDVSITGVQVNRDTSRAEVYYSILPPLVAGDVALSDLGTGGGVKEQKQRKEDIQEILEGTVGWLRGKLAPTLHLRHIPKLTFIYDPSLAAGAHIDSLLKQLRAEEARE